ncbi:hypothetical protein [Psychroserpens sp.]|uniref:hypothetical protein n=1 Tax=Psychroserpens sp. TaxID=2020870 RepID=UPI001B07DF31|nr:hypothetical protein [Psychroserpens sp.]MBO6607527.1 hypothetical protein [Psychroserpens sp.]MBO6655187.1 hypothetical protein [Psychroserpens sp.]MBO6683223.1 hypothetical protein [Psychroserpens sp.]MBO6749787.1 hypothetical protein [Psychroserpens sp.]MBO6916711.1 hypothetical protein [Psychroserpens sp.]
MTIELTRLLIDFGLVILIWMVQLNIYPSFLYYAREDLVQWHQKYTVGIAVIVIPLMFGQLGIYGYQLIQSQDPFPILGFAIVLIQWILTFAIFVPLHNAIGQNLHSDRTLQNLVKRNWWRTFLWSGLFVWSLVEFINTKMI